MRLISALPCEDFHPLGAFPVLLHHILDLKMPLLFLDFIEWTESKFLKWNEKKKYLVGSDGKGDMVQPVTFRSQIFSRLRSTSVQSKGHMICHVMSV